MPTTTLARFLAASCLLASAPMFAQPNSRIDHSEYPHPDFQRANWLNLNGAWDFRFDPDDAGIKERWWEAGRGFGTQKIAVPFCWQSSLSGIRDNSGQKVGWYRRTFTIPPAWKGRFGWLRFDAVAGEARVWVNGKELGSHAGGDTPFEFDLAGVAEAGQQATVVVRAAGAEVSGGKQGPASYTPTSGIWQTVWIEARPARYIARFSLTPRKAGDQWFVDLEAVASGPQGSEALRVSCPQAGIESREINVEQGRARTSLEVMNPRVWTPDTPQLYDLTLRLGEDAVQTYFGLRTIGRGRYGDLPYESVLLNGEPIYLRGALDQLLNPLGIRTAPDDAFLRREIELAKSLGLNFLRVQASQPRLQYWADRLGMIVMPDTAADSDLVATAPLLTSEDGATSAGDGDRDISWGLLPLMNQLREQEKMQGYALRQLTDVEWEHDGFFNYDRTRKEFGYDAFVPGMTIRDLQGEDFIGYEKETWHIHQQRFFIRSYPSDDVQVPLFISHFSKRTEAPTLRWWVTGTDDLGDPVAAKPQTRAVRWRAYSVVKQQIPLTIPLPGDRPFVGAAVLELLDGSGHRIAANFIPIVAKNAPEGQPTPPSEERVEVLGPRLVALRFSPTAVTGGGRFEGESMPGKLSALNEAAVEYSVPLPDFVRKAGPVQFELVAELATRAGQAKVDWPPYQVPSLDYPQTDARKFPGTVRIRIGGVDAGEVKLPDDPADSRGVLSNIAGKDPGSYGYVTRVSAPAHAMAEVTVRLEATNGISVYGEGMGRYGVDPVILVHTSNDVGQRPAGWFPLEPREPPPVGRP